MLKSMTGYGSAEFAGSRYSFRIEIKALNGKFLELNLRMPRMFSDKEIIFRNYISSKIQRGTVNIYITAEKLPGSPTNPVTINKDLASAYYMAWIELSNNLNADSSNILATIMQMPEMVISTGQEYTETDWNELINTFDNAYSNFDKFRLEEGSSLCEILKKHCFTIENFIPDIEKTETERIEIIKDRLKKNLDDLQNSESFDKNRYEQEVIYYLEKFDISEEKNRLKSHCGHFLNTLDEPENGRKLNFIAQEIGREINTMGAKAYHSTMQKTVVKMKEELEKIKEQVLNVL